MKKFAQIRKNKIRLIKEYETKPLIGKWIDITDITPQPKVDWVYNSESFLEPIIKKPIISKLKFYLRFEFEELVSIKTAAANNIEIQVFLMLINANRYIDLNKTFLIENMQKLVEKGLLSKQRKNEILDKQ